MHYNELYHYGIPGMKWGVRRFQNANGSYTPIGARRHAAGVSGVTSVRGSSGSSSRRKIDKHRLARNITLGVGTAAVIGGAAYGIHRLKKSGKLDDYAAKGREVIGNARSSASSKLEKYASKGHEAIGNARSSAGPTIERYANKGREVVGNARSKVNAGIDKVASLPVERYADRAYEKTRQQLRNRKKRR